MKHTIILSFLLGALFALQCSRDEGNYQYNEINEITIKDVDGRSFIIVNDGIDRIKIEPVIEMTETGLNPDNDRIEYCWYIHNSLWNPYDTIATTRVLDWVPNLSAGSTRHTLYLRVKDRLTGVTTSSSCSFTISLFHSRGWLLIGENTNGNVQTQLISMLSGRDTILYPNLLENSGLPTLKGPINFFHTGGASGDRKLWILTESGSYWIDNVTLKSTPNNTFSSILYNAPPQINVVDLAYPIRTAAGASSNYYRYIVADNGNLYTTYLFNRGDYYTSPVNVLQTDRSTLIPVKGPLLVHMTATLGIGPAMWYDGTNERFMIAKDPESYNYSEVVPDPSSDPFPWNQAGTGRTYIHGENTQDDISGGSNSFALMKGSDNKGYIYKLRVNNTPDKRAMYPIDPAPIDFWNASWYAFAENQTTMFYVANGKLYLFDYQNTPTPNGTHIDFWNGDEVTMAKIDHTSAPRANHLYVATWNPATGGQITKYILSGTTNLTKDRSFEWSTGFVKIKNMTWRGTE